MYSSSEEEHHFQAKCQVQGINIGQSMQERVKTGTYLYNIHINK